MTKVAIFDTNVRLAALAGLHATLQAQEEDLLLDMVRLEPVRESDATQGDMKAPRLADRARDQYPSFVDHGAVKVTSPGRSPSPSAAPPCTCRPKAPTTWRARAVPGALPFNSRGSVPGLDDQKSITLAAKQVLRGRTPTLLTSDKDAGRSAVRPLRAGGVLGAPACTARGRATAGLSVVCATAWPRPRRRAHGTGSGRSTTRVCATCR